MNSNEFMKLSQQLVDVVMGRKPADLVIRNGRWVSVQSGEIIPQTDIAIIQERIAYVGPDASHTIGDKTKIIDAKNQFLVPGLLDAHMHIESGMLTITEFARAVLTHGTTSMFVDPHEIANVFGLKGVRLMVDEASIQPVHVWVQIPSCVPSAPGFETPGASISPKDVEEAMKWENIIGLGEMMNFPGVVMNDSKMHAEMAETRASGKVIGGHYASPDLGLPFHAYVAGGPEDDHEGTTMEDAIQRIRQGMKVMLRFGSAWHDVAEGVRAITEAKLDPRHFILCTDDSHSRTLVNEGHIDRAIRQAIQHDISPITAIQMATINAAEHFNVHRDVGMIAPGRYADIILTDDLTTLNANRVFVKGQLVARDGKVLIDFPSYNYPDWAKDSVHLEKEFQPDDFKFSYSSQGKVAVNVIGIIENQAPTKHLRIPLNVENGEIKADITQDIAKVAVIERHSGKGIPQLGFVYGFGFDKSCAIASTVAHDCHNIVVVGTSDADMAIAVNELSNIKGGQIVVKDGEIIGQVNLPVAGLMSDERADIVAQKANSVLEGFQTCGCKLNNPNMQLSLLALVVIPELRISDLGLVDVTKFKFIPVIERTKFEK